VTRQRAARISVCVATRGTIEGRHRLVGLIFQLPRRPEISERIQYTRCCHSRAKFSVVQPIYLFALVAVQQPVAVARAHSCTLHVGGITDHSFPVHKLSLDLDLDFCFCHCHSGRCLNCATVGSASCAMHKCPVVRGHRRFKAARKPCPRTWPPTSSRRSRLVSRECKKTFWRPVLCSGPRLGSKQCSLRPPSSWEGLAAPSPPPNPRPLSALKASSFSPSILTLSSLT